MDLSKQKLILRLAFLLMLISIVLVNILNLLDASFFLWLESIMNYKLLLNLSLFTILILLYLLTSQKLYTHYKSNSLKSDITEVKESKASDDKPTENDYGALMENLSLAEKSKLQLFLKENRKVIWTKYDSDIKILCRNRILKCLTYNPNSPSEIMIEEWAWEWINKNKEKLS